MLALLRRIHIWLYAYAVKWFRTREVLRVFNSAHVDELRNASVAQWPQIVARQEREIAAVKAGRLDSAAITDRKSWSWPFLPASIQRLSIPILKSSPYNLRRLSRTPVPRRAINLVTSAVTALPWEVRSIEGEGASDEDSSQAARIKIVTEMFKHPNNQDSFQSFIEMGLEDMCCLGGFPIELAYTPDPDRPLKMWGVMVESIRLFAGWGEATPDMPHYAQMTGLKGERGAVLFYDDEMVYVKDSPSSDNPFGIGSMEIGFSSINDFLGIQAMSGRAGSDQIHKSFLWFEAPQSESHIQIIRRYIQNDLEGQAKLSLIAGMKKPEVVEVTPVTEQDLLLNWQELLIRMIANAFYMSPLSLGIERDVNRSTGDVLKDADFRTAVVPKAKKLQEAFTRKILHQKLGWKDLEFAFLGLDDPDLDTKTTINQKMYSMNAITPNQVRKSMNLAPLDTPLADLTQAEFMLLNAEAAMWLQQQASQQQMQQQQQMMQMYPPQPPQPPQLGPGQDQEQDQGNEDDQSTPAVEPSKQLPAKQGQPNKKQGSQRQQSPGGGGMSKGGPPLGTVKAPIAAPKALSLPKFPITGSKYNARQVALMPVNQVTDIWKASGLSAGQFLKALDDQEPGILQHLAVEVKQYFEEQLEEEEQGQKKPGIKNLAKFKQELGIKVRKQNRRVSDLASWLYQTNPGKPGSGRLPNKSIGRAGNVNPIVRG